jgi:hypothetical protein
MKSFYSAEKLGPPDLKLAGVQIWVHGRQYPNSQEPYDLDWLNVTAHCGESGASVWVNGAILGSSSFATFVRDCKVLYASLEGVAVLRSDEPNLSLTIAAGSTGHVSMAVDITPEIMDQQHRFRFGDLDQTFLPTLIAQCESILEAYPNVFRDRSVDV